jgi:plasmid replication initiation protein
LLILSQQTEIPFLSSLNSGLLMLHIKVKAKDVRFTIPVPYAILNIVISILSSKFLQKNVNKWTKEHFERKKLDFTFPHIDKNMLKPIVKELKNYKGIVLVDVRAKDGTEVKVRL